MNPFRSALFAATLGLAPLLSTGLAAQQQAGPQIHARWSELGPAPISGALYAGRVSALACSPTDPDRYFAAGADGGVWRTTDGGQTWQPLTDAMPTTAMGALALDPSDENVIYAGTGEANFANHSRYGLGIFKSVDGGDSWRHLGAATFAGRCIARLVVHPSDPQRVFAAVTRAGGFPELAAAKGHPGATGALGVFRSLDGGASWTHLQNGLPNLSATDLAIDPASPNVLYAGIGRIFGSAQNGVYKSTDGGASWAKLGLGLPTGTLGRVNLAVAPSQTARIYALIVEPSDPAGGGASTRGAWRSDNGGSSWTAIDPGSMQQSYGWYLSVVSVQPTDSSTAIFGGFSLRRTTNSGGSYSTITPPHVDLHAIAWDAGGRLLVGDDGGVHRSANLGSSWTSLNAGLGTVQFYAGLSTHPTDDERVLGGAQDNGSNMRTSAGLGWNQVYGGDGGWTQWNQADASQVWVEYQGTANLYRSTNGGGSFNFRGNGISGRNCFLPPFLIDPTNANRMLYGTERVWRTLDGGANWSALSPDLTAGGAIRALAMAPSNPNVVYAATNDGRIQASTNGGSGFTLVASGVPGNLAPLSGCRIGRSVRLAIAGLRSIRTVFARRPAPWPKSLPAPSE
ncbi:MAG TPA: hypothetical protein VGC54_07490 [Planctomycetota bacterium]